MAVPEYLDMILESLEPLAETIPEDSKLLFENFARAEPTDIDSVCPKHLFAECTLEDDGKFYFFHMYEECFMLVEPEGDNKRLYVPVLPALLIPHNEGEDIDPERRLALVGDWLMFGIGEHTVAAMDFCDSLMPTVTHAHDVPEPVFMPNRYPNYYGINSPVLFQELFKAQA